MTKKELKNLIKEVKSEILTESSDWSADHDFWVMEKGGSIGAGPGKLFIPGKGRLSNTFQTIEDATDYKKRMNRYLSPGEKKYYGLGYILYKPTPKDKERLKSILSEEMKSKSPVQKYMNLIYNAKTLIQLQKAWSKCLNNNDGLDKYDIAGLRSAHDNKKQSMII